MTETCIHQTGNDECGKEIYGWLITEIQTPDGEIGIEWPLCETHYKLWAKQFIAQGYDLR